MWLRELIHFTSKLKEGYGGTEKGKSNDGKIDPIKNIKLT